MKETFELKIGPEGSIETVYQDGIEEFAASMGADVVGVCRASHVEWEDLGTHKGWTVRSAQDPNLAVRISRPDDGPGLKGNVICSSDQSIPLLAFATREAALDWELHFFWELLGKERKSNG